MGAAWPCLPGAWALDELRRIDRAEELDIAPDLPDGAPAPATTIWVVRVGDHLYVRSFRGPAGRWYRHATTSGHGHITAGDIVRQVTIQHAPDVDPIAIDAADQAKYARDADTFVKPMLSPQAQATTLRLQHR
ncbi:MAG TPA: DUF2255 family protein [Mycobacterium sp.]|nr:DUF2255 family protein [Mycobacterium sp.]